MDVSRARVSTSVSNSCVNLDLDLVRAHGTCSTRTLQCRQRTRRSTARTYVATPHASRCLHSRAGLRSWILVLVSPRPEQIAVARDGPSFTTMPYSALSAPVTSQPLATRSCPVRMRTSIPPIRLNVCKLTSGAGGMLLVSRSIGEGQRPSRHARRHAPRRSPGAPSAPSEASLPWTALEAAWLHAAHAALTTSPRAPRGIDHPKARTPPPRPSLRVRKAWECPVQSHGYASPFRRCPARRVSPCTTRSITHADQRAARAASWPRPRRRRSGTGGPPPGRDGEHDAPVRGADVGSATSAAGANAPHAGHALPAARSVTVRSAGAAPARPVTS